MKTAVSLPDALFESADALAERLGVSRSLLYQQAIAEYLAKHDSRRITDRLNAVYGPDVGAQARTLGRIEW